MQWYELDIESRHKQATYQRDAELHNTRRHVRRQTGDGRSAFGLTARLATTVAALRERTARRRSVLRPAAGL